MPRQVDRCVLPLLRARRSEYQVTAEVAGRLWKENGQLEYGVCVGDTPGAEGMVSFAEMAQTRDDETFIVAWVVSESPEARYAANGKIAVDFRMVERTCKGFRDLIPT